MKKRKNNSKKSFIKILEDIILSILILSFVILIYCIYISFKGDIPFNGIDNYESKKLSTKGNESVDNQAINREKDITKIIESINKSIVGISKIKNNGNTIFLQSAASSLGIGTGFIVSEDGYIVSNQHVAGEKLSKCYVTLENGKTYNGNVVWSDSDIDLCIIKINANGLNFINLGDSNKIKIAEKVYAIGNPVGFAFERTVTSGIISAMNRTVKVTENQNDYYMDDLIQTDATINPGNSGGPLINENGEVIGINSVKITSAEGIGFASPINIIKPIIDNYKNYGNYNQPTIGIFAYDKNVIPYINHDLSTNKVLEHGIYIEKTIINSPAERSGLKKGDIILSIDNKELNTMSDLRELINSKRPGDILSVKYLRNANESILNTTLENK